MGVLDKFLDAIKLNEDDDDYLDDDDMLEDEEDEFLDDDLEDSKPDSCIHGKEQTGRCVLSACHGSTAENHAAAEHAA